MKKKYPLTDEEFKRIYSKVPRVCVDVIVQSDKGILLTKRKIPPYKGYWHLPGGTIYLREKSEDAVRRIVKKELGSGVLNMRFTGFYEILKEDSSERHSVVLVYLVEADSLNFILDEQSEELIFLKKISSGMKIIEEQSDFLKKRRFIL